MAAELKAGSEGLSRGWGKAWVFPHGLFLVFPRPRSDEVAHAAPSASEADSNSLPALWFCKCQFTSSFSPLPLYSPPPLSTE